MDMLKIIGIGISGTIAAIVLKEHKPVFSACIGMATALLIFLALMQKLNYIVSLFSSFSAYLPVDTEYIRIIIRIIGISYLTQFGSSLCLDAGQRAIAQKIELAGKVTIIIASVPILSAVLNLLIGILPS